jgi:hypothetical protein
MDRKATHLLGEENPVHGDDLGYVGDRVAR